MPRLNNNNEESQLRIIKTARTEKAINKAAEQGFRPLVKPVIPSAEIKAKFAITQNKMTGEITVGYDYRMLDIPYIKPVNGFVTFDQTPVENVTVIGWTYYYPYHFESPFAAYLLPSDLQIGETVMLEDLIEDIVGSSWNQGDTFRLKSCAAIWNGQDFILNQTHQRGQSIIVG